MKKLSIIIVTLFLVLGLFPGNTKAQQTDITSLRSNANISNLEPSSGSSGDNLSLINGKAIKDFKKSFKAISNEKWYVIEKGFMTRFTNNDIPTSVYYDTKGAWMGTIRNLNEKQLPKEIRYMLKWNFFDYSINLVREITLDQHLVYIAHLENETGFKNIRISDGEMDVISEYKK